MAIFGVNLFNDMTRRRADAEGKKESLGLIRDSDNEDEDEVAKRKLESAESGIGGGSPTKSESDVENWVDNIPTEGGLRAKTSFVWHRACTDKHFFTSLVRYL